MITGISSGLVWLLPTAIDGAMAVGTVTAVVVRRLHRSTAYAWTVVAVNAAFSVAGNTLHAYAGPSLAPPAAVVMAVSAIPALNLALSVHLLVVLVETVADVLKCSTSSSLSEGDTVGRVRMVEPSRPDGPVQVATRRVVQAQPSVVEVNVEPDGAAVKLTDVGLGDEARKRRSSRPPDRQSSGRALRCTAWEWAIQNRRPDGSLVSGEELARTFSRSPRWGRYVKREGAAGYL